MKRGILAMVLLLGLDASSAFAQFHDGPIPDAAPEDRICFALYTVHANTLKLTAQFYPIPEDGPQRATLEIETNGAWEPIAEAPILTPGYTATFRVDDWDMSQERRYRVNYANEAFYVGTVRRDPIDQDEMIVAVFSCNSVLPQHGGDIPKDDIIENVKRLDPDLLFFAGDQVYNHKQHYAYWLKFGRDFGEIIKDYPTVTIPDDHDVGHSNLWGAAGKKSKSQEGPDGGYFMPVEYVNMVQRAQTAHLPDPYDPTPIDRGITVYYTDLTWGGVSFAILEDRKWKTGPEGVVPPMGPRPDHVATPDYDPEVLDVPGAVLLGERQLSFLDAWARDWDGAEMKAVLSQTIFCGGAHLHGQRDNRLYADLDSNGWPQSGRNRALAAIRKAQAIMIAGDQHLATVIRHGIDTWNDAGYSFAGPAIANLYLRWWAPLEPGKNRPNGAPEYLGEFRDGFGNPITMHAVANPSPEENADLLTTRAAGWGVVRFRKSDRTIRMECWPRNVNIAAPNAEQYPGWPITIHQRDNGFADSAPRLPEIRVEDDPEPVVEVANAETGAFVSAARIYGGRYVPRVSATGTYTITVRGKNGTLEMPPQETLAPGESLVLHVRTDGKQPTTRLN